MSISCGVVRAIVAGRLVLLPPYPDSPVPWRERGAGNDGCSKSDGSPWPRIDGLEPFRPSARMGGGMGSPP